MHKGFEKEEVQVRCKKLNEKISDHKGFFIRIKLKKSEIVRNDCTKEITDK